MTLSEELKAQILPYAFGLTTLQALREKIGSLTLDAGDSSNKDALPIADELIGNLSDLDQNFMNESELQQNLLNLLFGASTSHYMEIRIMQTQESPIRTGSAINVTAFASGSSLDRKLALEYA